MLTPTTIIHTPGLIDPNRTPWTGTIAEHFTLSSDLAWDKLAAILVDIADHDVDEDLDLEDSLEALADAGIDDQELASRLAAILAAIIADHDVDEDLDLEDSLEALGRRLRDDWASNPSNWDDDISDLDGYEMAAIRNENY